MSYDIDVKTGKPSVKSSYKAGEAVPDGWFHIVPSEGHETDFVIGTVKFECDVDVTEYPSLRIVRPTDPEYLGDVITFSKFSHVIVSAPKDLEITFGVAGYRKVTTFMAADASGQTLHWDEGKWTVD